MIGRYVKPCLFGASSFLVKYFAKSLQLIEISFVHLLISINKKKMKKTARSRNAFKKKTNGLHISLPCSKYLMRKDGRKVKGINNENEVE